MNFTPLEERRIGFNIHLCQAYSAFKPGIQINEVPEWKSKVLVITQYNKIR